MLCVIPFCSLDADAALRLLVWINDLGGCPGHDCLLVTHDDTAWNTALLCRDEAQNAFDSVDLITSGKANGGWVEGANALFKTAAQKAMGRPFFVLDPDAVPLKTGWLDRIAQEYKVCGKSFMGPIVKHTNPKWPNPYLEAVSVYPADAWTRIEPFWAESDFWTRTAASVMLKNADDSLLVQHLWGEKDRPPTFAEHNIPGTSVFCLKQLNQNAVIFHRNKDGTLIDLLMKQRGIVPEKEEEDSFIVVLPFCNMDGAQAIRNLKWMHTLGDCDDYDAIMTYDPSTSAKYVMEVKEVASVVFRQLSTFIYSIPPKTSWPHGPNHAFQNVARHMQHVKRPWLWLEADAIPAKPNWLDALQAEYRNCGKPMMGPHVSQMGHCNGVCVYPHNFPELSPKAMASTHTAWDYAMKSDTIHLTHDASKTMQHAWGIHQGQPHSQLGPSPVFKSSANLSWLLPTAVLFHRCKDGSLIDRLQERINGNRNSNRFIQQGRSLAGMVH